jgi:hypothetical protein
MAGQQTHKSAKEANKRCASEVSQPTRKADRNARARPRRFCPRDRAAPRLAAAHRARRPSGPVTIFRDILAALLAGSERLRDNRRMTDAAHNEHSETRCPSDRDRIVTTGPSCFQPARPEVLR